MKRVMLTAALVAFFLSLISTTPPIGNGSFVNRRVCAADNKYIYCSLGDDAHNKRAFFSAVFVGDRGNVVGFGSDFTAFVHGHYSGVLSSGTCMWEDDRNAANRSQNVGRDQSRGLGREIIETNWSE